MPWVSQPLSRSYEEVTRRFAEWTPKPVLQDSDDWRLDRTRDLAGMTLHWGTWQRPSEAWDHDHCLGCWAKFMEADRPDILREGWTTGEDWPRGAGADWICPACFRDLKPFLGWLAAEEDLAHDT